MNQTITFQEQFEDKVRAGRKRQTIRPDSTFRQKLEVGSIVHLRGWKGKPYRSKQEKLGEGIVVETFTIIWLGRLFIKDKTVDKYHNPKQLETMDFYADLARRDGFKNLNEMVAWFMLNHPKQKTMRVIRWKLCQQVLTE